MKIKTNICLTSSVVLTVYTLLTLKYGVNLLNAPVSSASRQNLCTILSATWSLQTRIPIALLYTCSTSANYLLLRCKSVGSCCYGM